jgi:2-phospho-L-lactate guanylyltransferase
LKPQHSVFAVVPVKEPALGKSRLASILDAGQRAELCVSLARRTIATCAVAFGASRTLVVTASPAVARIAFSLGAHVIPDRESGGLNEAVAAGAAAARLRGADALLVVPADLPLLTAGELHAASAALDSASVLLSPDRHESGTNLFGLRPIRDDLFDFGDASFERHRQSAIAAGCSVHVHQTAALSLDLDTPADYRKWLALEAVTA